MEKNNLWLLDAHCDSFEMRNFLNHDFNLAKGRYVISETTKQFLEKTFHKKLPSMVDHHYQVTEHRLKKGNVKALLLNVADYDFLQSSKMISAAYNLTDEFTICYDYHDIGQAITSEKIALILTAEGPLLFHGKIDLLRNWHRLGIRMVSLSHGEGTEGFPKNAQLIYKNLMALAPRCALQISTSHECYFSALTREKLYKKEKGLSSVGKQMLKEMSRLNIVCDLSHANDAAFWESLEMSAGKFCATHSNCAAFCKHTRNLTDEMMKALAARGGVMGLCFYGEYIDQHKPSFKCFVEHILHALAIMGPDHVGIGSDFDGTEPGAWMAIDHPGKMHQLWEALDKAGVDQSTLEKIAHQNFMQLLIP